MKKGAVSYRSNLRVARNLWGELSRITEGSLRELSVKFSCPSLPATFSF
jgi:hypothetical protein